MSITIIKDSEGSYITINEAGEQVGSYKRISDIKREYRHEIELGLIKLQNKTTEQKERYQ